MDSKELTNGHLLRELPSSLREVSFRKCNLEKFPFESLAFVPHWEYLDLSENLFSSTSSSYKIIPLFVTELASSPTSPREKAPFRYLLDYFQGRAPLPKVLPLGDSLPREREEREISHSNPNSNPSPNPNPTTNTYSNSNPNSKPNSNPNSNPNPSTNSNSNFTSNSNTNSDPPLYISMKEILKEASRRILALEQLFSWYLPSSEEESCMSKVGAPPLPTSSKIFLSFNPNPTGKELSREDVRNRIAKECETFRLGEPTPSRYCAYREAFVAIDPKTFLLRYFQKDGEETYCDPDLLVPLPSSPLAKKPLSSSHTNPNTNTHKLTTTTTATPMRTRTPPKKEVEDSNLKPFPTPPPTRTNPGGARIDLLQGAHLPSRPAPPSFRPPPVRSRRPRPLKKS